MLSCDEAGRDGFRLHRHLVSIGIANPVVDAAGIEVSKRRAARVKTERLDGEHRIAPERPAQRLEVMAGEDGASARLPHHRLMSHLP